MKKEEIVAGHVYVNDTDNDKSVFVCIGKNLVDNYFVFMHLGFGEGFEVDNAIDLIKSGQHFSLGVVQLIADTTLQKLRDLGEFVTPNEIVNWFARLKLLGYSFSVGLDTYVGDWNTRQKLKALDFCDVKELMWYIPEPMAFIRQNSHIIKSEDLLWFYAGKELDNGEYKPAWYLVNGNNVKWFIENFHDVIGENYTLEYAHRLMRCFSELNNMIEMDDSWSLPKQRGGFGSIF